MEFLVSTAHDYTRPTFLEMRAY